MRTRSERGEDRSITCSQSTLHTSEQVALEPRARTRGPESDGSDRKMRLGDPCDEPEAARRIESRAGWGRTRLARAALITAAFCAPSAHAQILFVDADADAGSADGLSWATAYPDLQSALTAAHPSDGTVSEIWIADGVYRPAGPGGDRRVFFDVPSGVAVRGGFSGTETSADERTPIDEPGAPQTILSGDLNGDDIPGDLTTNKSDNAIELIVANWGSQSLELDRLVVEGAYRDGPGGFREIVGTAVVSVAVENRFIGGTIRGGKRGAQ